ncbi:hypothetical protein WJX73_008819 [Symbiochloris irregularis]|uniref:Uncharacterized protein n=1 Tax=Symbiochloris irregularis TaxID=706552 RepID=A0AAW1PKX1_9CHLO
MGNAGEVAKRAHHHDPPATATPLPASSVGDDGQPSCAGGPADSIKAAGPMSLSAVTADTDGPAAGGLMEKVLKPVPFGDILCPAAVSAPVIPATSLAGLSPGPIMPASCGASQPGVRPAFWKNTVRFGQLHPPAQGGAFVFRAGAQDERCGAGEAGLFGSNPATAGDTQTHHPCSGLGCPQYQGWRS